MLLNMERLSTRLLARAVRQSSQVVNQSFTVSRISNEIKPCSLESESSRVFLRRNFCSSSQRFSDVEQTQADQPPAEETFSSLMRNCKFTQMGDPVDRVVVGRIYHIVDNDLYIDFGHKFPCVCQRPRESRDKYQRGAEVLLKIKSLELSQKFLGHEQELTLLEADCQLLGLYNP